MDVSIVIVIDRIAVLRFVSITSAVEVEMLLNPKGLRMVSPPGFQIYLWPRVTLIFVIGRQWVGCYIWYTLL